MEKTNKAKPMKNLSNRVAIYSDGIGFVEYVDHMGSDLTVVNAARVSFDSHKNTMNEKDEKLLSYLIRNKHFSPFEHCSITYRVKVPLFIRSQHMRHRTWSYNEISRRYTSSNIEFFFPAQLRRQAEKNKQCSDGAMVKYRFLLNVLKSHTEASHAVYDMMIEKGVAREMARMVLPQNMYTTYYATTKMRNLFEFLALRTDQQHAQPEIVQMALAMQKIAGHIWPISMKYYEEYRNVFV